MRSANDPKQTLHFANSTPSSGKKTGGRRPPCRCDHALAQVGPYGNQLTSERGGRRLKLCRHIATEIDIVGIESQHRCALTQIELRKVRPDNIRRGGELKIVARIAQVADRSVFGIKTYRRFPHALSLAWSGRIDSRSRVETGREGSRCREPAFPSWDLINFFRPRV